MQHVTVGCPEISRIWKSLAHWIGCNDLINDWNGDLLQVCAKIKGKSSRARLLKTFITELIYELWIERNRRIFQQQIGGGGGGAAAAVGSDSKNYLQMFLPSETVGVLSYIC